MPHKSHEQLEEELNVAKSKVVVGGIYAHYKHPENLHKVIDLGTQEATDKICVIYQSLYGKKLTFVRDLDSWLETPELNGTKVERFKLVK